MCYSEVSSPQGSEDLPLPDYLARTCTCVIIAVNLQSGRGLCGVGLDVLSGLLSSVPLSRSFLHGNILAFAGPTALCLRG